jgi:hypothetical protein
MLVIRVGLAKSVRTTLYSCIQLYMVLVGLLVRPYGRPCEGRRATKILIGQRVEADSPRVHAICVQELGSFLTKYPGPKLVSGI